MTDYALGIVYCFSLVINDSLLLVSS
jgi:hypothetical protein